MNKKNIISTPDNTILKLKVETKDLAEVAEKNESIRLKLVITAKQLAATAAEKEDIRKKLEVTAEDLKLKAEALAIIAKEKEEVRRKLKDTAEELAKTAKDREDIRKELEVTAKKLAITAKEKEITRSKLAVTAKEKEEVRQKLVVTAKELSLKAEQLAQTAKEKEDIRKELEVTAKKLAITAKEKEITRKKLEVTAEDLKLKAEALAIIAKEKEITRKKLEVTAEDLKRSRETLEDKVIERTKDIAQAKGRDEAILQSIGEGLVVVDKEGKIIYVNQVFEQILGWGKEEVIGKSLVKIIPREDEAGNKVQFKERVLLQVLAGKKATISIPVLYIVRKDRTKFLADIVVTPIVIDNEIIGAVEVFRDVTREKDIDRMKTEFISLASHQLRTPLSAIRWFSEMLLAGDAGKLTKDQTEFVTNISLSNKRMIDLVNGLLNISRIESGRIIIDSKPTDLSTLVKDVLKEIDPKIKEKKQQVIISIHENLPKINIDPKLIYEVYKNLLTNANKYTPVGGEISIFISKKDKEVISQISDNGYGIPLKDQPHIFERFYRAENIIKLETEGTGLGLYLAKAIVESSSGKIWFESQEKVGTSFWFTSPISGVKAKKGEVTINS